MKLGPILGSLSLALALGVSAAPVEAYGRSFISVGIGVPMYRPWGYYGPYYGYGYPYYAPPPVVVQQPPVVVQPPQVIQAPAPVAPAPPPVAPQQTPQPYRGPAPDASVSTISGPGFNFDQEVQALSSSDEGIRQNAALNLGRLGGSRAVDPLAATLAGDGSPTVRDAAARGLGLIGDPRSLLALIRAAQADNDRDVRHSAQFAVEIIRSRQRN